MTAAVTTALMHIEIDAAVAAAGAGAFVAATLGPEAIAPAEAAAYSETLAYAATLPGLDLGAWEIPRTMLATLHQGESVVPRDFASGMRTAVAGGGQGDAGRRAQRGSMNLNLQVDRNVMRYSVEDLLRAEFAAIQAGARR
jgi:hypothetical protein